MKDRAQRRQSREKALKKALEFTHQFKWTAEEDRIRWAYRTYKHPARCSCAMCGNPRRYAKGEARFTLAERRLKENTVDLNRD